MPTDPRRIEHVVIVIMENRSFDHMLGYLSLVGGRPEVDGIRDGDWRGQHANPGTRGLVEPYPLTQQVIPDPPHERDTIAIQIGNIGAAGSMKGFVKSYATRNPPPDDESLVMGFYTSAEVPIADFFAKQFLICDQWFSALPTGTQPNRLMAMSGIAMRETNAPFLLDDQPLVYDWLNERKIPWRVYHHGVMPFFALMPQWQSQILHDLAVDVLGLHTSFRRYEHFARDVASDPTFPPVVFVEPEYTDGPHHDPDDDHPPSSIQRGQEFLRTVYQAITASPERWAKTLVLITYDEHGGFYDHVEPRALRTAPPPNATYLRGPFTTTGVRVPAFVVSPFVEAGRLHHPPLDHTSLLAFLGRRFDAAGRYSPQVDERQATLGRLEEALTRAEPRTDIPVPPWMAAAVIPSGIRAAAPIRQPTAGAPGAAANAQAFEKAARKMVRDHPVAALQILPELAPYRDERAP